MRPESKGFLADVLRAVEDIASFTRGMTVDDYCMNREKKMAVERCFEIAGEALTRLRNADPETFLQVGDARHVIKFRNVIAHGYNIVDDTKTWSIIETNVPILTAVIRHLLAENEPPLSSESEPDQTEGDTNYG